MYKLKGYQIPEASRQSKGTAIVNLLSLEAGEKITAGIPVMEFEEGKYLLMATRNGVIKKTDLMDYNSNRKGGLLAIHLDEDDELIQVNITDGNNNVLIATHNGMAIRFKEADVRPMGRVTRGVRSIKLREGDFCVGMTIANEEKEMLVVTEKGYGKKTDFSAYKTQSRGGMGVKTYKLSETTGKVVGMMAIAPEDDLMIITSAGIVIRIDTSEISSLGRTTRGVRLVRLEEGIDVVSIAACEKVEESDEEEPENTAPESEE